MRALSLWQPWAHAVVHLGKRIENRTAWKSCNVRGPFLIHASKGFGSIDDFNEALDTIVDTAEPVASERFFDERLICNGELWVPGPKLERGGIIGAAYLEGVVRNEEDFARYVSEKGAEAERQRAWWFGEFALVLREVIPMQFRPWKGKQGWFDVPWADPIMRDGRLAGITWREA